MMKTMMKPMTRGGGTFNVSEVHQHHQPPQQQHNAAAATAVMGKAEVEALTRELEARKRQLRKLLQQKAVETRRAREEERQRSIRALGSLRERLHHEKLAELSRQKEVLTRSFEREMMKKNSKTTSTSVKAGENNCTIPLSDGKTTKHNEALLAVTTRKIDDPRTQKEVTNKKNSADAVHHQTGVIGAGRFGLDLLKFIDEDDEEEEEADEEENTLEGIAEGSSSPPAGKMGDPHHNQNRQQSQTSVTRNHQHLLLPQCVGASGVGDVTDGEVTAAAAGGAEAEVVTSSNGGETNALAPENKSIVDRDASSALMCRQVRTLTSQIRFQEDENRQLVQQVKKMESLQSAVQAKNREFCSHNLELISANRKLSNAVNQLTASNVQLKQEVQESQRHQQKVELASYSAPTSGGPFYLHPPPPLPPPPAKQENSDEKKIRKKNVNIGGDGCEEDSTLATDDDDDKPPSGNKMSLFRTSSAPLCSWNKDRWWNRSLGDFESSSSLTMAPIEEEQEVSDLLEEKSRLSQDNLVLSVKVNALEQLQSRLEMELKETKDQNELLEFRILELEEDCSFSQNEPEEEEPEEKKKRRPEVKDEAINTDPLWEAELTVEDVTPAKGEEEEGIQEYRDEKLAEVRQKLQCLVGSPVDLSPKAQALLVQTVAVLELCHQKLKANPDPLWWMQNPTPSLNDAEKMQRLEDDAHALRLENKNLCVKVAALEKHQQHQQMMQQLSGSGSSTSEVSDSRSDIVSQGGETGYSSDDSIDTEEIYHLSLGGSNSHSPSLSLDSSDGGSHHSSFQMEFEDILHKIGGLNATDNKKMMLHKEQEEPSKNNAKFVAATTDNIWCGPELVRLNKEEVEKLVSERDALKERCLAWEEAEKNKVKWEEEAEKRRRVEEEEQKARVDHLQAEKGELQLQIERLSALLDNSTQTIKSLMLECSQETHSVEAAAAAQRSRPQSVRAECSINNCMFPRSTNNRIPDAGGEVSSWSDSLEIDDDAINTAGNSSSSSCHCSLDCGRLLVEKEAELERKEAEYLLKMDALKCDHDETVTRLQERLEETHRSEVRLKEEVERLLQSNACLEKDMNAREIEAEMDRTTLTSQIENMQRENAEMEERLQQQQNNDSFGSYFSCDEEVYEDEDSLPDALLSSACSKIGGHRRKIRDLETQLSRMRLMEVEKIPHHDPTNPNDAADSAFMPDLVQFSGESGSNSDQLMDKLQEVIKSECSLKQRIFELEKKEVAYRETLHEADKIMSDVEKNYQERIEELESSEEKLRARIVQLEQSEKRLRQAMRNSNRNSEVAKLGELLDRLLETEASEQRLKGRIHELEAQEKDLRLRLGSCERERESVESELRDQEELVQSVLDLKRTETELRARVEEMSMSESALKETLSQADAILAEREGDLQQKVDELEAELEIVHQLNRQLQQNSASSKKKEGEEEVVAVGDVTHNDNCDKCRCDEEVGEATKHVNRDLLLNTIARRRFLETDGRRVQTMADILEGNARLELQTMELQSSNENLRKQVLELESEIAHANTEKSLVDDSRPEKSDRYLELNLALLARDSQIETLQDRIRTLEAGNLPAELQNLSFHGDELKELKDKINSMSAFIQSCNCCNCANCRPLLHDIESQVQLLDEIVFGNSSDMREDREAALVSDGSKLEDNNKSCQRDKIKQHHQDVIATDYINTNDPPPKQQLKVFAEIPASNGEVKMKQRVVDCAPGSSSSSPCLTTTTTTNTNTTNFNRNDGNASTTNPSSSSSSSSSPPSPRAKKRPPPVPPKPPTPPHLLHLRNKAQHQTKSSSEDLVKELRQQMAQMESDLVRRKKELHDASDEVTKSNLKLTSKESELDSKVSELSKLTAEVKTLQKENEEYRQRVWKAEVAERVAQEKLGRKNQEAVNASKQVRETEQKVLNLGRQLRNLEQVHHDTNGLRDRVQELEVELQKRKDNERKLYAENLHLHHKVEAQRERINSLQLVKKDYRTMLAKYEALEKKTKIAEQAVTPLRSKVVQLTQKCKDRDLAISRLNRQNLKHLGVHSAARKTPQPKRSDEESSMEDAEHSNGCKCPTNAFSEGSEMGLSDLNSSLSSSTSSETFDTSKCHERGLRSSRIPRYTALSSPMVSPRGKQHSTEMLRNNHSCATTPERKSKVPKLRFLSSPRLGSSLRSTKETESMRRHEQNDANAPNPPTNFRVTRKVGEDGLLLAWTVPRQDNTTNEDEVVSGYQIFVNGVLHQKVRSPNRTKALLNGLNLSVQHLDIAIHSVTESGVSSRAARTSYCGTIESDSEDTSSPPLSARSLDEKDLNQNIIKRKCVVRGEYDPCLRSPGHDDPFVLCLQSGDLVTVFGQKQANGFYYGEVHGQRGLIPAEAVEEIAPRNSSDGGLRISTERSVHTD